MAPDMVDAAQSEAKFNFVMKIYAILFFFLFLYFTLRYMALPKPLPGIPFNWESQYHVLGDIPELMKDGRGLVEWLLDQSRRHNGPIFQLFLRPFGQPYVMLCDYHEIQDLMLRRKEFDRSDYTIELLSTQAPNHHINLKTGPTWKAHRRLLQDLMLPEFLQRVAAPNIYSSIISLINMWEAKRLVADGKPFSAARDIFHSSLDTIFEFSFGQNFPHKAIGPQANYVLSLSIGNLPTIKHGAVTFAEQPVHKAVEATLHASEVIGDLIDTPWPKIFWWFRSQMPSEARRVHIRDECIEDQVRKSVRNMPTGEDWKNIPWVESAVDMMMHREKLNAEKEGREPVYWSPSIRDEIFGFIVAGHDTVSTTILWGLKFLSDCHRIQRKLYTALCSAHQGAMERGDLPSAEEIMQTSVPYLDAVIEEILRLSHSLAIHDRQATCDTQLLGHHIPKGIIVMMLNRGPSFTEPGFDVDENLRTEACKKAQASRSSQEWDADFLGCFMPERWLKFRDGKLTLDASAGPTLPFGLGIRSCYGKRLAYLELRITFTLLI